MWQQIEPPQKIDNRIALITRQPGAFHRNVTGCDNSKTDRFTVKKFAVIASTLDRMADGMTEIEDYAFTGAITLVFGHDSRLYLNVATDERREIFKIDIFKSREHFR